MATLITATRESLELVEPQSLRGAVAVGLAGGISVSPPHIAGHAEPVGLAPDSAIAPITSGLGEESRAEIPVADRRAETPTVRAIPYA